MVYDRKIKYLDYMENGERVKGSGFVKLEIRDKSLRLEMTVTGLHPTDTFTRDVMLRSEKGESAIGRIEISGGRGNYRNLCPDLDNICGTGISYEELRGLSIPLGTGREVSCSWQGKRRVEKEAGLQNKADVSVSDTKEISFQGEIPEESTEEISEEISEEIQGVKKMDAQSGAAADIQSKKEMDVQREGAAVIQNTEDLEAPYRQEANIWKRQETAHNISGSDRAGRDIQTASIGEWRRQDREGNAQKEEKLQTSEWNRQRNLETVSGSREELKMEMNPKQREKNRATINLLEDKWSQLWAIYPHIRPFQDEREYLSIGPADFVLFPSASYKMVNNSFLLHGYYNYNHLLLARLEKKEEIFYYIGVPGNFFEKEKQVAIMFGFESFECAEEPAQVGDFGYYMMRTEL